MYALLSFHAWMPEVSVIFGIAICQGKSCGFTLPFVRGGFVTCEIAHEGSLDFLRIIV